MNNAENKNKQNFCSGHWNSMLGDRGELHNIFTTPNTEVVPYIGFKFDYGAN